MCRLTDASINSIGKRSVPAPAMCQKITSGKYQRPKLVAKISVVRGVVPISVIAV